jgi:hypothetical protein
MGPVEALKALSDFQEYAHKSPTAIWGVALAFGILMLIIAILGQIRVVGITIPPVFWWQRLLLSAAGLILIVTGVVAATPWPRWVPVGDGDCPGTDINTSKSATPIPGACDNINLTAICWEGNCNYKKLNWQDCTKGDIGKKYRCVPQQLKLARQRLCSGADASRIYRTNPQSSRRYGILTAAHRTLR